MREKTLKEVMFELENDLNQLDSLILQLEEHKKRRDSIAKTLDCLRIAKTLDCLRKEYDCGDL